MFARARAQSERLMQKLQEIANLSDFSLVDTVSRSGYLVAAEKRDREVL